MKAENILTQIGVSATPRNKEHARKLLEIFKMLSGIKSDIVSAERVQTEFNFGKETTSGRWDTCYADRFVSHRGDKVPAETFTIKTKTGTYKQTIPLNNDLHRAFCELVGQPVADTETPIFAVTFDKEQTKFIKKALSFVSKDQLRESMNWMRFEFEPGKVKLVATDGHKLLVHSFQVDSDLTETVLIKGDAIRATKGLELNVKLYPEHYELNSMRFKYYDGISEFPDYSKIWPEYTGEIVVFKNDLEDALKAMRATVNRTTKAARFYFNGDVTIEGEDVYFSNESQTKIGYLSKTAPDFKIGFNIDFLLDALKLVDSSQVKISTDGEEKPILINDELLICPVKLLAEVTGEEEVSNG